MEGWWRAVKFCVDREAWFLAVGVWERVGRGRRLWEWRRRESLKEEMEGKWKLCGTGGECGWRECS